MDRVRRPQQGNTVFNSVDAVRDEVAARADRGHRVHLGPVGQRPYVKVADLR